MKVSILKSFFEGLTLDIKDVKMLIVIKVETTTMEIMNAVLFLFIGFELLLIKDLNEYLIAGGICIMIVLIARWVAIYVPTKFMSLRYRFSPQTVKVLVWGGIRGGVSIALALSIPINEYSQIIISITYCVVVFSIIVQGLTIAKVANPKKIATEEQIKKKGIP